MEQYDKQQFEYIADECLDRQRFSELLTFATKICLTNPPEYLEKTPSRADNVVAKLGVRGLACALDSGSEPQYFTTSQRDEYFVGETIMRSPEMFSRGQDTLATAQIEQFGEALLDEAYRSLGVDVEQKIHEFTAAETIDDQIRVLEWLVKRMNRLVSDNQIARGDNEENPFYHPIRLSPKALGVYPQHQFRPTCLGMSVLSSSFVQQTGTPMLHAGMLSDVVAEKRELLSSSLLYGAKSPSFDHNPALRDRLKQAGQSVHDGIRNSGFHAVTLVQLLDESWYVIDPNLRSSYRVTDQTRNEAITAAQEDLETFEEVAPGLERCVRMQKQFSWPAIFTAAVNTMEYSDVNRDELVALCQSTPENLLAYACEYVHARFTEYAADDSLHGQVIELMKSDWIKEAYTYDWQHERKVDDPVSEAIIRAAHKYFLWDEHPDEVAERIARDPEYCADRLQDLSVLPQMAVIEAALFVDLHDTNYINFLTATNGVAGGKDHTGFEIGRSAFRVGATVLSDFATAYDFGVSPAFWLSNWASKIPITETLVHESTRAQETMLLYNATWLEDVSLKYYNQDDIIKKQYSD